MLLKNMWYICFAFFLVTYSVIAMEIKPENTALSSALLYLYKYGYLQFDESNIVKAPDEIIQGPLADFQAFAGINVTGVLDKETLTLMNKPRCNYKSNSKQFSTFKYDRCGVRDIIGHGARSRKKR